MIDIPLIDLPLIDISVIDISLTDMLVIDIPLIDIPMVDISVIDMPVIDIPVIDIPKRANPNQNGFQLSMFYFSSSHLLFVVAVAAFAGGRYCCLFNFFFNFYVSLSFQAKPAYIMSEIDVIPTEDGEPEADLKGLSFKALHTCVCVHVLHTRTR